MNVVTGNGNDSVYIAGGDGSNSTISTGEGNDTIYNVNCGETSINSGDGDDVITNYDYGFIYENVSIMAGSGNDTIYLPANEYKEHYSVIQYIFGDGNDIVQGFKDRDTLQISGADYSTMVAGNDLIVEVGNGKMTLVDYVNKSLRIKTNVDLNKYPVEDSDNNDNLNKNGNSNPKIPDDAFVHNGHSYYLFNNDMTWAQAKAYCESMGGHLVTITDSNEQSVIENLMQSSLLEYKGYWLGGFENNSNWQWLTGENFNYRHFSQDEPNGSGSYLQIYASDYTSFNAEPHKWDDTTDDSASDADVRQHGFICEWDISKSSGSISTETSYISYADLTPEQLQQLQVDSFNNLQGLVDSFENMDIEDVTMEDFDYVTEFFSEAQSWRKYTKFLFKLWKQGTAEIAGYTNTGSNADTWFSLFDDIDNVIVTIRKMGDGTKSESEINAAKLSVASKITGITGTLINLTSVGKKLGIPFAFITSAMGFASNIVASTDGTDKTRKDLERGFFSLAGETVKLFIKEIGEKVIANAVHEAFVQSVLTNHNQILSALNSEIAMDFASATGEAMQAKLNSLLSPFGPVNAGIAILTGTVLGIDQYNVSKAQYTSDRILTATRDAYIDAAATGIYEAVHKYTFGADDSIVQLGAWIGSLLTGQEPFNISDYGDNWVDLMVRGIKYDLLNEWDGTNKNDAMISSKDGERLYGKGGDDWIRNFHSNMTIYGGTDCDTVLSNAAGYSSDYSGTAPTSGTHNNYIELGSGDDSIEMYDYDSTVYGGSGNDTLLVIGANLDVPISGNKIFGNTGNDNIHLANVDNSIVEGGEGNDYILLQKANNNTIIGGSGDDYIEFQASDSNVIEYGKNGGNDIIVGYNESDKIKFKRFTEGETFSTVASGNDVIVQAGDDTITLKDANGKQLNVDIEFTISQSDSNILQKINDSYEYTGGNRVIPQYLPGTPIRLASDFVGLGVSGNSLVLKSSSGDLTVEDCRNKVIDFTDDADNIVAYTYLADREGVVDGSSLNTFEVFVASENLPNHLIAGNSGSSLISGGSNDTLQGGAGQDTFIYNKGNDIVSNYQDREKINFAATYTDFGFDDSNFYLNAAEGSLAIQNHKDKWIDIATSDGNVVAHAYVANNGSVIDGRSFNELAVIVGGNNARDTIYAGSGDSSLWGGNDGFDTLAGGSGVDMFFYGTNDGDDWIQSASENDVINLYDVTLADIIAADWASPSARAEEGAVFEQAIVFTSGRTLGISNLSSVSPTFQLADGSKWQFNRSTTSWQSA